MSGADSKNGLWGVMAEFTTSDGLLDACNKVREAGYSKVDAYTPYPIEEVSEALGHHHSKVPLVVLTGGLLGGFGGFSLCYWVSVIEYPLNIGGRPFNSWPAFIVPTFECTILLAGLSAAIGMLLLNGLPQPYHPVFNVARFAKATKDGFFLAVEAEDPKFDRDKVTTLLQSTSPSGVYDVEE